MRYLPEHNSKNYSYQQREGIQKRSICTSSRRRKTEKWSTARYCKLSLIGRMGFKHVRVFTVTASGPISLTAITLWKIAKLLKLFGRRVSIIGFYSHLDSISWRGGWERFRHLNIGCIIMGRERWGRCRWVICSTYVRVLRPLLLPILCISPCFFPFVPSNQSKS